jgi:hypothetical protein
LEALPSIYCLLQFIMNISCFFILISINIPNQIYIYMKKLALVVGIALLSFNANAQSSIQVPYFGTMTSQELCGRPTCQPGMGGFWAPVKGGRLYDGEVGNILGRSFRKSLFETSPCTQRTPTENDINVLARNDLSGRVEESKKKNFDAEVNANLAKLINTQIVLPESVKANLLAQLKNAVETETSQNIELEYKIIELKQPYVDSEVDGCYARLPKRHKIITGIGVITVKGSWASNTLKKAFNNFEANASAFDGLSAEAKAEYERSKERVLSGKFDPLSMIINSSYKYKSRRS